MFAFLGLTDAQLAAALVAAVTALVTTIAATPLRYLVDRALLVKKAETEYQYEARKVLRSLIGGYHGRVLDAAVDFHHRMTNLYDSDSGAARHRLLDVRGKPDGNYYYLSTVRRFLNLAALGLRFERDAIFIDARIAEHGDREFLYFVRAFRWAMTSETPFADFTDYPRGQARDHFFSDQYRALFAVITDERPFLDQPAFEQLLNSSHELQPVLDFFDGLSPDEQRFRWDRLVILHLLLMAFISGHGYPMQEPGSEDYERAVAHLRHPDAGPRLLKRLPRLGLDGNPAILPVRRAIDQAAAASVRERGTPPVSAPT
jgi:hypothetical protein